MNKQEFIDLEISKLKKTMYKGEDMMTEEEEKTFREFFNKFIEDLKEIAQRSVKTGIN